MTRRSLVAIWVALLFFLGLSLAIAGLGNVALATSLIFSIALLKAGLVVAYYMRLKWEPRYILGILLSGVAVVAILYFTLIPDIVYQYGG